MHQKGPMYLHNGKKNSRSTNVADPAGTLNVDYQTLFSASICESVPCSMTHCRTNWAPLKDGSDLHMYAILSYQAACLILLIFLDSLFNEHDVVRSLCTILWYKGLHIW